MDFDDYDEFGNFIGSGAQDTLLQDEEMPQILQDTSDQQLIEANQVQQEEIPSQAIVMHEDKKYYPSASEIYGPSVQALVQEEDTQPISEPLVKPPTVVPTLLAQSADRKDDFLVSTFGIVDRVRNLVVLGNLHHGKTSLVDLLVNYSASRGILITLNL